MYKILGLLVMLVMVALGGLALAQEEGRTQEELSQLPMYERLLEGEDAEKATALKQNYEAALQAEDWAEARKFAQKLLDFRIAKQGADHYEVTDARLMQQNFWIWVQLEPEERRRLVEAKQQDQELALLNRQGHFSKAAELGERILATRKMLLGEKNTDFTASLNNHAISYRSAGDFAKAAPLLVRAISLNKELLGDDHPHYATCLNNLAVLYRSMGEFFKAESLHLQAFALRKKLHGENHPNYADSLNNLGLLYLDVAEYPKAEPLLVQARDIRKTLFGENHPNYADSLNNLAQLYVALEDYTKAEPLFLKTIDLRKKLLGESHSVYAASLSNLAALYVGMGEYGKAEPLLVQARDLYRKLQQENLPDYALSLNNLGVLYYRMGDSVKAEPLLVQARDLQKKAMGVDNLPYARSLGNLALVYKSTEGYSKAELQLAEARDIVKKLLGDTHPDYAKSLNNLATLYTKMGDYAKAEPMLVQACDLYKKLLGESNPSYAASLINLAGLHESTGEYVKAESLLVLCARSFEMSRLARASDFQRAIGGDDQNPYFSLATVYARLDKQQQGFNALERNLARAFLDVQAQRQGKMLSSVQQARRSHIINELSPLEKRIAVLVGKAELTNEETKELDAKIAARSRLNVDLAELAAELSTQEVGGFASIQHAILAGHALLTWVDVSTKIGLQEHWACALTSSGEPFWVALPGSGENRKWSKNDSQLPSKLREALAQPVPPSNLPELIEQLRRQRIEPVLAHLKEHGINQLYVVGVGQMAGLPVEVIAPEFTVSYIPSGTFLARLPEKPKFENNLFAVGDPIYEVEKKRQLELTTLPSHGLLIDAIAPGGKAAELGLNPGQVLLQYAETKLNSVDDLKAAVQLASAAGAKTAAVTVWSVDEANNPSQVVVNFPVGPLGVILDPDPAPLALGNRRQREALFASLRGGEDWQDLPGTRYEVEQLGKLFPTATVLLDDKASEATVDALRHAGDLDQFRYLHFATHGKGNNVTAFESKLVLSQNQPKGEIKAGEPWYNNEISAREVLDFWKLNADLVTLSACQTGLGRQGGGDGLLGFAQAFLLSGARSVCLSLWEVDDIATALLMQRFYQNMLGQREGLTAPLPKAKALEEAKQWLRNLNASEATALTAKLTGGIARGTRGEKTFKLPSPSTPEEIAAADNYRPYARPHYWSAFILIGEAE